jgi:hypothetical protein
MGLEVGSGSEGAVSCPHCKKEFAAPLMSGRRNRGFKCPHCRLFVPLDRAADTPLARDSS